MAATATITSADGNYAVATQISMGPDGLYVVDLNITTFASADTLRVRVNGTKVWEGLAAESAGG